MDRLNFRKKMAVFISFVMILQVVLCNVGYAAEGRIEFSKEDLASFSFSDRELTYNNGVKIKCEGLTASYNGTNPQVVSNFNELSDQQSYHFEATVTDSIAIEVTVPTGVDNNFIGLDIAGQTYDKGNPVDETDSKKYTFTYTLQGDVTAPINVDLNYSNSQQQPNQGEQSRLPMGTASLGLTIGGTVVIENGTVNSNNVPSGLKIEYDNKDKKYKISVEYNDSSTNEVESGNRIAKLNLGAFVFTGNGDVEISFQNQQPGFEPDCIVDIGKINSEDDQKGYSIYDTEGVNLSIRGSWNTEVSLEGGIYSSYGFEVCDIRELNIGKNSNDGYSNEGIIGNANNKPEIILQSNVNMYTSGMVFSNFYQLKAMNGATVTCKSYKTGTDGAYASTVQGIDSVFVKDGGEINISASGQYAQIANSDNDIKNVQAAYFDSQPDNITGLIDSNTEKYVSCTANGDTENLDGKYIYNYSGYASTSFKLVSTTEKQMSIFWEEKTGDYKEGMDLDKVVYNGKLEIKSIQGGIKRVDSNGKTDYTFAEGSVIKFKLVPNPGYEYVPGTFSFNGGNGTGEAVEGEIGVYEYTMGNRPVHISCVFKKATNTVSDNSTIVSNSSIELSDESKSNINGSLALKIADTSLSTEQVNDMKEKISDSDYTVDKALNLNLNQEIDKMTLDGTEGGKWSEPLTDLTSDSESGINNAVTITLGLDSSLQGKEEYTIIREHITGSGENSTEYTTITPTVDRTNNTITFETDKFSTYAIAYKGTRNVPVNPPVSNPDPTPTPTPTPEPTPAPTPAPTEEAKPSMAPVSEEVTTSVSKEVESVVQEIVKGTDTTVVDEDTATKIKEAAEQGKEINTEVVAETVEKEKVDTKEVKAIEEKVKSLQSVVDNVNNTIKKITSVAQFINVEILIKADGEKLGNLKELKEPIKLVIAIPDDLKAKSRKFFVVRLHDGKVEKLESIMNADGTLTFITDKFSTYALAYEDTVAVEKKVGKTKIGSTTRTSTSVTIPWSKVAGATKYRVYYKVKGAKSYTRATDTASLKYTVKGLKPATTYIFAVKAYGNGKWSDVYATKVTTTSPSKVNTPTVIAGSRKATVKYSKVTGATGYEIYMAKENGKYVKVKTTTANSYTRTKLTRGATYKFKVRAFKKVGSNVYYGAYSSAKVVKVK